MLADMPILAESACARTTRRLQPGPQVLRRPTTMVSWKDATNGRHMTNQTPQAGTAHHDCGWANIHRVDGSLKLGRGHLYVTHDARTGETAASHDQAATGAAESDVWLGVLDSLRLEAGDALPEGRYRLRLEANGQDLEVDVFGWQAVSPSKGSVSVRSADGVLPAMLEELGGED